MNNVLFSQNSCLSMMSFYIPLFLILFVQTYYHECMEESEISFHGNNEDTLIKEQIRELSSKKPDFKKACSEKNYERMIKRILDIKDQCGDLCADDLSTSSSIISNKGGFFYDYVQTNVDCKALWNTTLLDEPSRFPRAIQRVPTYLKKYFSYNNKVSIKPYYFDNIVEEQRTQDGACWRKYY